ncbi:EcsC family protein [Arthrobacter sp. MDT1-65]
MQPSEYELNAWRDIQNYKGRPVSGALKDVGKRMVDGAAELSGHATTYMEDHPRARSAVSRGQEIAAKGTNALGRGKRLAAEVLPSWSGTVLESTRYTGARISRLGLTPKAVVVKHKKQGHAVASLSDLRRLDLEQIDAVRGRGDSWGYPIVAAAVGIGTGLVITGGGLAIAITSGAAAAPSGGAITGAMATDTAAVLGLTSRCVGKVSLHYGYDPEVPAEKMFVMTVINAATAMSAGAKTAAMADISKLTQALFRRQSWEVLDKFVVAQVSKKFAGAFGKRLTKQGLGKVVPGAGAVIGSTLNWATLESVIDLADVAYRRRFLLEKYPHLAEEEVPGTFADAVPAEVIPVDGDEVISVLDEITEAGGPDIKAS